MVAIYVRMIKNGKLTLDDVPARWQEDVKKELVAQGIIDE